MVSLGSGDTSRKARLPQPGVALFREQPDGSFRVSLRSKRRVDVAAVAAAFGGGGHVRAAGLSITGPLEAAVATVTARLREAFDR